MAIRVSPGARGPRDVGARFATMRWLGMSLLLALILSTWQSVLAEVAPASDLFQVDSDFANRCALYVQRADTPGDDVEGDVLSICRSLQAAAKDGGNAPNDCIYFTTVVEGVPVKQAMAACDALLQAGPVSLLSAPKPSASSVSSGPAAPAWVEEVLAQLISAQLQINGKQPDDATIERMRNCLIKNQDLGRNRALAPCAQEFS